MTQAKGQTINVTVTDHKGKTVMSFPYCDETESFWHCLLNHMDSEGFGNIASGFCGGHGVCGRCQVRFLIGAPLPSVSDRKFLTPQQLRSGYRLACTAKPQADCSIELCFAGDFKMTVVSEYKPVWNQNAEGNGAKTIFCAVDIGTTTVVMQLIDRSTGRFLAKEAFVNPQRKYGADVISRIEAAGIHGSDMCRLITAALEDGLLRLQKKAGQSVGKPDCVIIAANTAMVHLLMGYPTENLGRAPFVPYHQGEVSFSLGGIPAWIFPGISAFVGADIVSGMYACQMAEREDISLLIDLGTNGEIALGNRNGILCTATAAGTAFEGGSRYAVPGSDMISVSHGLLERGILDETGLLSEPWFTQGYRLGESLVTQGDIRKLQMAKAAVAAGVVILLERMEIKPKEIAHVYLAGGFGYFLDSRKAGEIGLLPAELADAAEAVGNSSLAGAVRFGMRPASSGSDEISRIVTLSRSVNLAKDEKFEDCYIRSMNFKRYKMGK